MVAAGLVAGYRDRDSRNNFRSAVPGSPGLYSSAPVKDWRRAADNRGVRPAFFELCVHPNGLVRRVPILGLPFIIGRGSDVDHPLDSGGVSKRHAVVVDLDGRLAIRDLDSTNGTFVNGTRIVEQVLKDGDIVHVADVEMRYRLSDQQPAATGLDRTLVQPPGQEDLESRLQGAERLDRLLLETAVEIHYQPIVDLAEGGVLGYEALGQGAHVDLAREPGPLLRLAERCDRVLELCELFRLRSLASGEALAAGTALFLNLHPIELAADRLGEIVGSIRRSAVAAARPIVLEVSEASVMDVARLRLLRAACEKGGLLLAYDDFGAGQARLVELTEVPPDYLKLDRALISGIAASPSRQNLVRALVSGVRSQQMQIIAEGIETAEEAEVCRELGCGFGQGFYFGRPEPV